MCIRDRVDIRLTRNLVEVYYKHHRICSHKRLYGHPGQYSTNTDPVSYTHLDVYKRQAIHRTP